MFPPVRTHYRWRDLSLARPDPVSDRMLFLDSGTAALYLVLCFLRDQEGLRQVILSPFNCRTVLLAIQAAGLTPRYCDFAGQTLALDLATVEQPPGGLADTLLLYSHLFGFSCGYSDVVRFCRERQVVLVDDGAHLLPPWGADQKLAGDFAFYSFGRSKPLNIGGGGALLAGGAWRARFHEYVRGWRCRPVSIMTGLSDCLKDHVETNPAALGVAIRLLGLDEACASADQARRLAFGELRTLNAWQVGLISRLTARSAEIAAPRLRLCSFYLEWLRQRGEVQFPFSGQDLHGVVPLRLPILVAAERRDGIRGRLMDGGLWCNSWIRCLLAPGPYRNAAAVLDRLLTLPLGLRLGCDLSAGKLSRLLTDAFAE